MKKLMLIAIFLAPMGAKFFSLGLGSVRMSAFRLIIILSVLSLIIKHSGKITVGLRTDSNNYKYSICFMFFWLVYSFISVIWSIEISLWLRNILFVTLGFILVVLLQYSLVNISDIVDAFRSLQLGITVQAIIGWYEIITRDYKFIEMTPFNINYYINGVHRIPIAMQMNENNFALLMFIGIYTSYICSVTSKKRTAKIIHLILLLSDSILLVMTTSRACLIGLLLSVAFMFLLNGKKRLVLVVVMIMAVLASPQITEYIMTQLNINFRASSGSVFYRINLIRNGLKFLGDTFGFGVGAGQFEGWMSNEAVYFTNGVINMHNWWMEILVDYGVMVFIGYIIFYCKLFKDVMSVYKMRVEQSYRVCSVAVCAIMVGFLITSVTASSNIPNEWLWVFWGICITYQGILPKKTSQKSIIQNNQNERWNSIIKKCY